MFKCQYIKNEDIFNVMEKNPWIPWLLFIFFKLSNQHNVAFTIYLKINERIVNTILNNFKILLQA